MTACWNGASAALGTLFGRALVGVPLIAALGAGVVSALPRGALAEERAAPDVEAPGLIDSVGVFIDGTQQLASDQLLEFVSSVDGFFAGDVELPEGNRSRARIRLQASRPGDETLEFDARVKLRIVLPQSEQRFRLLLSSEEAERDSVIGENDTSALSGREGDDVSLALRFIRSARENSSVKLDLGVRQRERALQVFGRVNASIKGEVIRDWHGRVSNNYQLFSKSGYENRLRFSASRPISDHRDLFFQTVTGFGWRKGQRGASIGQTLGLYAEPSERSAIAFEALADYATALNGSRSARYGGAEVRIRWRHSVWRPWFHYEIWPSFAWPASNGYRGVPGGLLRIEVTFGQQP